MPTPDTTPLFPSAEPETASRVLPPVVYASPSDLANAPDSALNPDFIAAISGNVPFWRPGFLRLMGTLGWRWIFFFPSALTVIALPLAMIFYNLWVAALFGFAKLWVFALGVTLSCIFWAIRNGVRTRRDPFCIHCGYSLTGAQPAGSCPECGRPYVRGI
ncbi:hypothetical protein BH11PLA1_BH11PLA1_08690 [soil metagenome]